MARKQYILHQYIYATPGTVNFEGPPSFLIRHGWKFGWTLAVLIHFGFFAWMLYQGFFARFGEYDVVDREYDVEWISLNDARFKPLKNPGNFIVSPTKTLPIEEAERRRREEEKRRREDEKKRKADAEKAEKEKKDKEAAEKKEGEETAANDPADKKDDTAKPQPKFGQINSRPIQDIVAKLYKKYQDGELNVDNAVFSITLSFKVMPDGSLRNVEIVKSSGSTDIDEAALNIARAVSESRALGPLSTLSSTTITLDSNLTTARLRVTGFASEAGDASALASVLNLGILAGKFSAGQNSKSEVAAIFDNMDVKADGKRISANVLMTRSQAASLMKIRFGP